MAKSMSFLLGLLIISVVAVGPACQVGANCDTLVDKYEKIDCYVLQAVETKTPRICHNLKEDFDRSFCYSQVASKLNIPEICQEMESKTVAVCLGWVAINLDNSTICENLEGQDKAYCYRGIAVETGNYTFCDFSKPDQKTECYEKIAFRLEKPQICKYLGIKREVALCLTNMAIEFEDITICDSIEGDYLDFCYEQYGKFES